MIFAAPRPRPARELGLAALFFLAITVLMTWPQAAHLNDALSDVGDAKLNARILQWDFAQTFRDPLHLYQLNFFHPARDVLAFSENLYGVALFGFPLLAGGASALLNYNVLLLLGMFLSALAAWALAREITGDPIASAVSGLVFAFLPWRWSQLPHLQFQWAAFLCLSLLFLVRYLEGGRRRDAVLFGACFGWNALCNVHYALFSGVLLVVTLAVFALRGAEQRGRRLRGAILAAALGGAVFVPFALPYREASRALRDAAVPGRGADVFRALDRFPFRRREESAVRPCHWRVARGGRRPVSGAPCGGARRAGRGALASVGSSASAGAAAEPRALAAATRARAGRRDPAPRRGRDLVAGPGGTAGRPAPARGSGSHRGLPDGRRGRRG